MKLQGTNESVKTIEEQNKELKTQGIGGYDKKIILSFRIEKKKFFEVSFGDVDSRNQAPYFSTSAGELNYIRSDWKQCGQSQESVLPKDSLAYKFYKKWDKKHLCILKIEELEELENDLQKLKEKYPYIKNQNFRNIVAFDRKQSDKKQYK